MNQLYRLGVLPLVLITAALASASAYALSLTLAEHRTALSNPTWFRFACLALVSLIATLVRINRD